MSWKVVQCQKFPSQLGVAKHDRTDGVVVAGNGEPGRGHGAAKSAPPQQKWAHIQFKAWRIRRKNVGN